MHGYVIPCVAESINISFYVDAFIGVVVPASRLPAERFIAACRSPLVRYILGALDLCRKEFCSGAPPPWTPEIALRSEYDMERDLKDLGKTLDW